MLKNKSFKKKQIIQTNIHIMHIMVQVKHIFLQYENTLFVECYFNKSLKKVQIS